MERRHLRRSEQVRKPCDFLVVFADNILVSEADRDADWRSNGLVVHGDSKMQHSLGYGSHSGGSKVSNMPDRAITRRCYVVGRRDLAYVASPMDDNTMTM